MSLILTSVDVLWDDGRCHALFHMLYNETRFTVQESRDIGAVFEVTAGIACVELHIPVNQPQEKQKNIYFISTI